MKRLQPRLTASSDRKAARRVQQSCCFGRIDSATQDRVLATLAEMFAR
ncbi:MAG: hypothetical protein ACRELX_01365 [Longimicrobiales bacterium]